MEDAPQTEKLSLFEIAILLVVTGLVGGGGYLFYVMWTSGPATEQFQAHIGSYLTIADKITQQQDSYDTTSASHEGRVVAIDVQQNTVDAIQTMLPDYIRADDPGDVTLLMLVDCNQEKVGSYGASDAYSVFCRMRLFDIKLNKIVWESLASNSPPRRSNPVPFVDVVAERPDARMVELLTEIINVGQSQR